MMKRYILLLQSVFIACLPVYAASGQQGLCEYFFSSLKTVPHDKLTYSDGAQQSFWDGKNFYGCEVEFVTSEKLLSGVKVPDFDAAEDSHMYERGWRVNNSFVADGPGTGVFGVEKESVLCLVRHAQPAYLEDYGNIIQSEMLKITVQCRNKNNSGQGKNKE